MKFLFLFICLSIFTFTAVPSAQAGSLRFGKDERVVKIKDVKLQGPAGEALYLGHLVETQFFGLGVRITDKGYVIGVQGRSEGYFPMPGPEKIAHAQKAGLLPEQLPSYSLTVFDYALGYSLWIFIAAAMGLMLLRKPSQRNTKKF